jgi:hypothetical protein
MQMASSTDPGVLERLGGLPQRVAAGWARIPLVWRRRVVVMAVLGFLVAVPVTLLLRGGDDDPQGGDTARRVAEVPRLHAAVRDDAIGVRYRVPLGWSQSKEASVIRLRSGDRTAGLTISAPAPAGEAQAVLESAIGAIRENYLGAEVQRRFADRRIGGLAASSAIVAARNPEDTPLRFLLNAASGDTRTYLVEVYSVEGAAGRSLVAGQVLLRALRLTK